MTNKIVSMYISDIEKSSKQFKKTHKVKVSGPYNDEEMPKWFLNYMENFEKKIQSQFDFVFAQFDFIFDQFKKHGWIKK